MTECFWCNSRYDNTQLATCPQCQMNKIFDQALDKHKEGLAEVSQLALATGMQLERQRSIKLIQENMMGRDSWLTVIELIQGDAK